VIKKKKLRKRQIGSTNAFQGLHSLTTNSCSTERYKERGRERVIDKERRRKKEGERERHDKERKGKKEGERESYIRKEEERKSERERERESHR